MKAVILAAGEGTRLRPFTISKPKVMIPIANRPIMEYAVEALSQNGIRDIVIVVGYKKESIMSHFEDGKKFGVNIQYVVQSKPLGTAHALLQAEKAIDIDFLVLPGDNFIDPKEISYLVEAGNGSSMLISESEIPSKYGVVFLDKGIVTRIVEKPTENISNLISTGIYRFSPSVFEAVHRVSEDGKHALTSVVQHLIDTGEKIQGIHGLGKWIDAVYPWDIVQLNASAFSDAKVGTAGNIEKGAVIKGKVFVGEGSIVRSGAYIEGPAIIGRGCDIGPNVCIFPSTTIGDNVSIQPFTLIRHSVIMDDAQIGSSSTITHSVIGEGVRIGSHFSTSTGKATIDIESGYHKVTDIGAMIGGDTLIGDQVALCPGVIIGAKCTIAPMKTLEGSIPDKSKVV